MKVYIINKIGYQYNDNYYQCDEDESGRPVGVYKSKDRADLECSKLNNSSGKLESENYDYNRNEPFYHDKYYEVIPVDLNEEEIEIKKPKKAGKVK